MTVLVKPRPQPDLGCCAHFPSHAQHVHCRGAGWHEMRSMHSARHPAPRHPTLGAPRLGSGAVGPGAVEPVALGAVGPGAVGPAFATQPWTYRPQRAAAGYSRCETGSPRAPHARRPPHLTVRLRSPGGSCDVSDHMCGTWLAPFALSFFTTCGAVASPLHGAAAEKRAMAYAAKPLVVRCTNR